MMNDQQFESWLAGRGFSPDAERQVRQRHEADKAAAAERSAKAEAGNTARWEAWIRRVIDKKMVSLMRGTGEFLGRRFHEEAERQTRARLEFERRIEERLDQIEARLAGASTVRLDVTKLKRMMSDHQKAGK
ncbi:hypothetical protein M728_000639 [Ensifer sp. WSM1721]|uniref:hypothetical protein n=1 Tax=Ensifer sp. WSM1721 TaxID=1041159 RepID=UPI00047988CF|nr:hypothetical protein [Ensifer sp. WSM1721]